MRKGWLPALIALLLPAAALAQQNPGVQQSGPVTSLHLPAWATQGVLQDGGGAAGSSVFGSGYVTELGITNTGTPLCITNALLTSSSGYYQLCMGAKATVLGDTGGFFTFNAYGGAAQLPLVFEVNGANYDFPGNGQGNILGPNSSTLNELMVWANTAGTLAKDGSGVAIVHTGNLSISGNTTIGGILSVTPGATTLESLSVLAGASVGTTLSVVGGMTVGGNASVTGDLGVTGALTAASTLGVTGDASIGGDAAVVGAFGVTGITTIGNNLTVTGGLTQFGSTAPVHVSSGQTTPPALTSCGTSPSDTGSTDTAGTVTMGTGTPTGCVITFTTAYTSAPHCTVTWRATPLASQSYDVSTTAITLTQTATDSNVVDYICVAPPGG